MTHLVNEDLRIVVSSVIVLLIPDATVLVAVFACTVKVMLARLVIEVDDGGVAVVRRIDCQQLDGRERLVRDRRVVVEV